MTGAGVFGSLWTGPREDPRRYRVDLHDDGLVSVGDGGEGLVYRGVTIIDGTTHEVAIKMLTALTLDDYERLADRAEVLAQLDDPHIMRQLDTFIGTALIDREAVSDEEFDVIYTVAEWVPGSPLDEAVAATGFVAGLGWVAQIARAVDHLHAHRGPGAPAGVVHRDIKPSNVRINPDAQAVLIDFGIARPQSGTDLTDGVGTYLWRAPEVVGGPGKPGAASDNWGVGALAYWVLIGEPPRLEGAAAARDRLSHIAREKGLPDPPGLSRHIANLLETHPDDRPQNLVRWADDLDAVARGALRRRKWIRHAALVAALVLVVAGAGAWLGVSQAGHKPGYADPSTVPIGQQTARSTHSSDRRHSGSSPGLSSTTTTSTSGSITPSSSSSVPNGSTGSTKSSDPSGPSGSTASTNPSRSAALTPTTSASTATTQPQTATTTSTTTPAQTYAEATGDGPVHTWQDPNGPSGAEGPTLAANNVYQVVCVTTGTPEGPAQDSYWYLISGTSSYGSADAFCDEGATTCPGGFAGTPNVDSRVPSC
jgi:serine/threonine protein kinase